MNNINVDNIKFSFLIPTRGRIDQVKRLFQSILDTTENVNDLEIILVVDDDDAESHQISDERLNIKIVIVPTGQTMGTLNNAGFDASSGQFIMLMNDDVVLRTPNWDTLIWNKLMEYPDQVVLIQVNDLLFRERLCTFPMLSRQVCDAIGLCPTVYRRYRIDDHIYETFQMLSFLGHVKILYLEDIVFEHLNHELIDQADQEHVHQSDDGKLYVPNEKIIQVDAQDFDRLFEQRKQDTITLTGMIGRERDENGNTGQTGYAKKLAGLQDSYSYRRPDFIKTLHLLEPEKKPADTSKKTTVAVVTADIFSKHAQKCLSLIKQHTRNYELIILDNDWAPDFNHPREINKVLGMAKTDHVVLLDDDVYVEANWLENMLACFDDTIAVVTPIHKDKSGQISYTGIYMKGYWSGDHAHTLDIPTSARDTQTMCSAVTLIDTTKVGDVLFDTDYNKYFLDIDYGLQIWDKGYRVVCAPDAMVTHIGGATIPQGSNEKSQQLWRTNQEIFEEKWIKTGRLKALSDRFWRKSEYLMSFISVTDEIEHLFQKNHGLSASEFAQKFNDTLKLTKGQKLLEDYFFETTLLSEAPYTALEASERKQILSHQLEQLSAYFSSNSPRNLMSNTLCSMEKLKGKKVAIFGAGVAGLRVLAECLSHGIEVNYFLDNNPSLHDKKILNHEVRPIACLAGTGNHTMDTIIISSYGSSLAMFAQLKKTNWRGNIKIYNWDPGLAIRMAEMFFTDKFQAKTGKMHISKMKNVAIFGASVTGENALEYCQRNQIEVRCFIDNAKQRWGEPFSGITIKSVDQLVAIEDELDGVILASLGHADAMKKQLRTSGFSKTVVNINHLLQA